jgi:hypothetical protein
MVIKILSKKYKSQLAKVMLLTMAFQILAPLETFALTSGPSQPESSSFEPVGTTDMVNLFSGDFNYNIPLLDVEGYPINIAYHSGATTDEEASWVGLGWNINPGNISRVVRGNPDDFDGDKIEKKVLINDEKSFSLSAGLSGSKEFELFGKNVKIGELAKKVLSNTKLKLSASLDLGMNYSNYSGISATTHTGISPGISGKRASIGVNMGVTSSTNSGLDFDYSAYASAHHAIGKSFGSTLTGQFGQSLNSREGLKNTSFGFTPSIKASDFEVVTATGKVATKDTKQDDKAWTNNKSYGTGFGNSFIPAGLQNFVPVVSNVSTSLGSSIRVKVGGEIYGVHPSVNMSLGQNVASIAENGDKKAYGFNNLQNASSSDIVDFARDRDGRYHKQMKYLPPASMSYDILSINGQGTGGSYRPYRNDIGSVYDPALGSSSTNESAEYETGTGQVVEFGMDATTVVNENSSGPWMNYYKKFLSKQTNSLFEPVFYKQAGEISESNIKYNDAILGNDVISPRVNLPKVFKKSLHLNAFDGPRSKRSNLLYYISNAEASNKLLSSFNELENYNGFDVANNKYSNVTAFNRVGGYRKAHHIGEVTQLLASGVRYNYGLPAMNIAQHEVISTVSNLPDANGLVNMNMNTGGGTSSLGQNLFSSTKTPPFAYTYLLTSILSPNYSDLTGNGITDDDLGNYTKFNYSLKEDSYQWRSPYDANKGKFDQGVLSDCHDDKANAMVGNKEVWMLHSIETKNFVAEFHTSPRADALASNQTGVTGITNSSVNNKFFKLDKIVLYNKKDKFTNGANAVPIKTVLFSYDYSLCKNVPNSTPGYGKLTLKAISIKYGNSDIGMLSPYRFEYSGFNPNYNFAEKDVWGNFKPINSNSDPTKNLGLNLNNMEFPYVNQNDDKNNDYASAWNLTKVFLPSGGQINVEYEADNYAYVQDRKVMNMFKVEGVGSTPSFSQNSDLYQNLNSPNLYLYFKRSANEIDPTNLKNSYLGNKNEIMFNFNVQQSNNGVKTVSCANTPLIDQVKGYAAVEEVGISDATHGYIKLKPKFLDNKGVFGLPGMKDGFKLNPISIAAINYARYYNNKALYPKSEITLKDNPEDLVKQLFLSKLEMMDMFINPLIHLLSENKGLHTDISKSYVRLQTQGAKMGGGHRVKSVKFSDQWNDITGNPAAEYGSEYSYTTTENGKTISSGVASYEPIGNSDENPFKELLNIDKVGNSSKFPASDPVELFQEGPLAETMFPSASVGYAKVTVKSINKSKGQSSQVVQENEFFTAKDFPVVVKNSELDIIEQKDIRKISLKRKKEEIFNVGQGYSIFFNDMHGKPKQNSTKVDNGGTLELIAYTKNNYFIDEKNKILGNAEIPCLEFKKDNPNPVYNKKSLGEEKDLTIDTRQKIDMGTTRGAMMNVNSFVITPPIVTPIPVPLPKLTKSKKSTFSSVVATKIIQQYGIIQSIENFDKGAKLITENIAFDELTGQPLITRVSTEHQDNEYQIKYPAYWAYRGMGPAFQNIQYEEEVEDVTIKDNILYFKPNQLKGFQIGDELHAQIDKSCSNADLAGKDFRLWVTDIGKKNLNNSKCNCEPNNPNSCNIIGNDNLVDNYMKTSSSALPATTPLISYEGVFRDHEYDYKKNRVVNKNHEDCGLKFEWLTDRHTYTSNPAVSASINRVELVDFFKNASFPALKSILFGAGAAPFQLPMERLSAINGLKDLAYSTPMIVNTNALTPNATTTAFNSHINQKFSIQAALRDGFKCRGNDVVSCANHHIETYGENFYAKKIADTDPIWANFDHKSGIIPKVYISQNILRVKIVCELQDMLYFINSNNLEIPICKFSEFGVNDGSSHTNATKTFTLDFTLPDNYATLPAYASLINTINSLNVTSLTPFKSNNLDCPFTICHPDLTTSSLSQPDYHAGFQLSNGIPYYTLTNSPTSNSILNPANNLWYDMNYSFPYIGGAFNKKFLPATEDFKYTIPGYKTALKKSTNPDIYAPRALSIQLYPKYSSFSFGNVNMATNIVIPNTTVMNNITWPAKTFSDFPDHIPDNWGVIKEKWTWSYKSSFEIIKRPTSLDDNSGTENLVVCKPIRKTAFASDGTTSFPANGVIDKLKVKVIRSGFRNLLAESVQEVELQDAPITSFAVGGELKSTFSNAMSISAKTYTDKSHLPESLYGLTDEYFNEVVLGAKANYKVKQEFMVHKLRAYGSHLDKNEGTFNVASFWKFVMPNMDENMLNRLSETTDGTNGWYKKSFVNVYAPWGADLEVIDASGNKQSNLFGYGQTLPTAIVSNCAYNNALFENFEDFQYSDIEFIKGITNPKEFYQNLFRRNVLVDIENSTGNFSKVTTAHTGNAALQINTTNTINIPLALETDNSTPPSINTFAPIKPFYFRKEITKGKNYVVSCWQKVSTTIPNASNLKYSISGVNFSLKPMSPNIDGWVLYQGTILVPINAAASDVQMIFNAGATIDDIRILPEESNMKAYVYDYMNRRLLSVLDENHFATNFDYTDEGKLLHVKKETEKGILTLKESRESLRAIINPTSTTNYFNLNNGAYYDPYNVILNNNWTPSYSILPTAPQVKLPQ